MQDQKVLFGIDHFLEQADKFRHVRFALATNNSATTAHGILTRIALMKKGVRLTKLFSPEHGLTAQGDDGAFQNDITDRDTGLPVISLYGDQLKPSKEDLSDIDAVLFDIPDAGSRFYTYLWTMTYLMEACAESNKPLFILDRPNPISGDLDLAEGPMLDETNCSSFIGRWSIPIRHSCTLGELARYFTSTRVRNLDLQIIKVQNWQRKQLVFEANWLFVPPSPAITDAETALLYPGMGLLEGLNVNEGRGTHFSFKIFGAPWINASQIQSVFQNSLIPGISAQPCSYTPSFGLYCNEPCNGLALTITDHAVFRPVQTGMKLVQLIWSHYPGYCRERLYKTTANPTGEGHLDKLTGVFGSFKKLKDGKIADRDVMVPMWKEAIMPYLLYE